MKFYSIFLIVIFVSSCTSIKEGISYKKVFKELSSKEFLFAGREKIYYGEHNREYYVKYKPDKQSKRDIIFFIHGGGWKSGSVKQYEYIADYFVDLGYETILINYPLYPDVKLLEMKKSILKAYYKVVEEVDIVNGQRVILGGASAGSHLAANLYYDDLNNVEKRAYIKSFFSLSGVLDFEYCRNMIIKSLIRNVSNIETNPINHIKPGSDIPAYLIYSKSDGLVNYKNSISFGRHIEEMGANVEYLDLGNYSHDESYVYPFFKHKSRVDSFNKWLEFETRR